MSNNNTIYLIFYLTNYAQIHHETNFLKALQTQINNLKSQIDETEKQNTLLSREVEDVERQVAANQSLIVT